jgi:hypothetical protein
MAKTPNIQVKGAFRVGSAAVDNTMPLYKSTGDAVTLKQLLDRPSYYLSKIGKIFDIEYDTSEIQKESFWITAEGAKGVVDPSKGAEIDVEKFFKQKPPVLFSCKCIDDGDHSIINNATYRLRYNDPIHGTKNSRDIKYYYTCEEIQHILDNDFISGVSGFSVSSAGDINWPIFGPYLIENNSTGLFNQTLELVSQSSERYISGVVDEVYEGDVNDRAIRYLKFHKTGQVNNQIYQARLYNFPQSFLDGSSHQSYMITANSISQTSAGGTVLNNAAARDFNFNLQHYIEDPSQLDENNEYNCYITGNYGTGVLGGMAQFNLYKHYEDFEIEFDTVVDSNDMDRPLHIINAIPKPQRTQVRDRVGIPTAIGLIDLESTDSGIEYNSDNFWYVGAPYAFHAHPYFNYKNVTIKNSNDIEAFRIPKQNEFSFRFIERIECTNNPNLTYIAVQLSPNIEYVNFSGCNIDNLNHAHQNHPDQQNSGQFPYNMHSHFDTGRHSMKGYDGQAKDNPGHDLLNPMGYFVGSGIKYVNFHGNNLNQTGINHLLMGVIRTRATGGYLDISNQKSRSGPQAAIFNEPRTNPYENGFKDYNNQIISGIKALVDDMSWTVKYDGSIPNYPSA